MHPGWVETPGVAKSLPSLSKRLGNSFTTFHFRILLSITYIYPFFFFLSFDCLIVWLIDWLIWLWICSRLPGNLRTSEEGADTVIWLALQPKEKLVSGAFYFDRAEAPKHLMFSATGGSHVLIDSVVDSLRSLSTLSS